MSGRALRCKMREKNIGTALPWRNPKIELPGMLTLRMVIFKSFAWLHTRTIDCVFQRHKFVFDAL